MAGRIQILTRGYAGEYLTTNPDFTYFNNRYAKYTNFSKESFSLNPMDQKDVTTGDTVNFRIPIKRGDLLNGISFNFTIPENLDIFNPSVGSATLGDQLVPVDTEYYGPQMVPIDNFGISMIEHVELFVGTHLLDKITSDDIFIHKQTRNSQSHRYAHSRLYGDDFMESVVRVPGSFFNEMFDGQFERTREFHDNTRRTHAIYKEVYYTIYNVSIPFYFHERLKYGFPLCALDYQELEVRIKLRNGRHTLFPTSNFRPFGVSSYVWNFLVDNETMEFPIINPELNINVTYLDTPERMRLKCQTRDILIEQRQHNYFKIEGGVKNEKFRLDFKNCVKELYFLARKTLDLTSSQIETLKRLYNSTLPEGAHESTYFQKKPVPCIYMKQEVTTLTCDNVVILDEITGSSQFLTAVSDLQNTATPYNKNIIMYSFALHPDMLEPTGHLNFSAIKDAIVDMTLYYDGTIGVYDTDGNYMEDFVAPRDVVKDIIVTAKSYNVLRFENGVAKLLF